VAATLIGRCDERSGDSEKNKENELEGRGRANTKLIGGNCLVAVGVLV